MSLYILTAILSCALGAIVTKLLGLRAGTSITVTRPTTQDGEQVSISTLVPKWWSANKIGETIQAMSLATQLRMEHNNELILRAQADIGMQKWVRLKRKIDADAALSKEERKWWQAHSRDFTEDGPVADLSQAKLTEASGLSGV